MLTNKPQMDVNASATAFDDELIAYANKLRFGELHFKFDHVTGMLAIIAIHNTHLGPALGGCRFREYPSFKSAIKDAMRLAQGMSYKAAVAGLPLGGGKAVIIKTPQIKNRQQLFEAFGRFIDELGGRYITAVDSGTGPQDMDIIGTQTRFVTSKSQDNGDPSPFTARGVYKAISGAVKFKMGKEKLAGLHIVIQGVGHVGYILAKLLHEQGVKLSVTDIAPDLVARCVKEFGAEAVKAEEIYQLDCDVFAPCALGAIINDETLPLLKCPIIVGAANNQLAEPRHGQMLHERGILYGPDYVVNAGGLIYASSQFFKTPLDIVNEQVNNLYPTIMTIFERSQRQNQPTSEIADAIAEEILNLN